MEEIWKDIVGFEGLYQVSSLGRVKSFGEGKKERILAQRQGGKGYKENKGYYYVTLSKENKIYKKAVHRLVAIAFVPNPENKKEVCHKDENKHNNNVDNLVWGTHQENCNYPLYLKRQKESQTGKQAGEKNGMYGRKRTEEEKEAVRKANSRKVICEGKIFSSIKACANYYGVYYTTFKCYFSKRMPKKWKELGLSYYKEEKLNEEQTN